MRAASFAPIIRIHGYNNHCKEQLTLWRSLAEGNWRLGAPKDGCATEKNLQDLNFVT